MLHALPQNLCEYLEMGSLSYLPTLMLSQKLLQKPGGLVDWSCSLHIVYPGRFVCLWDSLCDHKDGSWAALVTYDIVITLNSEITSVMGRKLYCKVSLSFYKLGMVKTVDKSPLLSRCIWDGTSVGGMLTVGLELSVWCNPTVGFIDELYYNSLPNIFLNPQSPIVAAALKFSGSSLQIFQLP